MHVWGGDTFGCVGQDTHVEVCESLLEIGRRGLESGTPGENACDTWAHNFEESGRKLSV